MSTYEIISLIIATVSLIVGGVANIRINKLSDSNKIRNQKQNISGNNNNQAGRDIM